MLKIDERLKIQVEHRTIREFRPDQIPQPIFEQLMEVGRRTATSNGMQQYSIIRITDAQIKEAISEISHQAYIAKVPELLIFIADQHRNAKIAKEKSGSSYHASDMDRFFQAFTDACLAAQNIANASEQLGLGVMFLGSIHNDTEKLCDLLKLPELTFPVVGLGLGYPNQSPQVKPRLPNNLKVFENNYHCFDNYLSEIQTYDQELQTYYDLRNMNQRVDSFSDQVVSKSKMVIDKRQDILKTVKKQGFTNE